MSVTRRVVLVVVGALVIVLGLGGLALVRSDESASPEPTPSPGAEVQTLLLQVLDASGYARGNVIVGTDAEDPESSTDMLFVPGSLLVPQGDGVVTLGTTSQSADTLAGVTAIEQGLGVRVDAGLTLDRLAFAGLVDSVGGVAVELDTPVLLPAIGADDRRRVVGPGWVSLDGIAAADYAVIVVPGETDEVRIQRFLNVLGEILKRLPATDDEMRQVLTSLGSLAPSTVPTEDLVPFLLAVRADVARDRVRAEVLPVDVIRGGVRPASVMTAEGEALVDALFPTARVESAEPEVTG